MKRSYLPLLLLLFTCLAWTPANAQSFQVPEAWSGIWDFSNTDRDCDTHAVIDTYEDSDTLCAGEAIMEGSPLAVECTGSLDNTTLDMTCTGSQEIIPGCTLTYTFELNVTRTGDSMEGTQRVTFSYVGTECGLIQGYCEETTFTATRTAPAPANCGPTLVNPKTWGKLKALYD